jgi:hypothetical protein
MLVLADPETFGTSSGSAAAATSSGSAAAGVSGSGG